VQSELLGTFYNDMFARIVPSNHVVVLRSLEQTGTPDAPHVHMVHDDG
jgi:hypothetical protein